MRGNRAHHNVARTLGLFIVLAVAVVFVASRLGPAGFWLGLLLAVALSLGAYVRADAAAVRAMRGYAVSETEQPVLCRIVRETSTRARIPVPRVFVSPTRAVNALAAGRGPSRAAICVTEGTLDALDENELRAVVGHELAHIRSRDVLPASLLGVLIRAAMVIPVLGMAAAYVGRLVVGRSRELDADREAARLSGDPLALASALRKLDAATRELVLPPDAGVVAAGHLMITSPVRARGRLRLPRSHPSTAERIAQLERLAGYRR